MPEVAGAAAFGIPILGVAAVDPPEEDCEGVLALGDDDPVDVVDHEAPGEDAGLGVWELGGEELEVGVAVLGGVEDGLAVYSALGDVVGEVGEDAAWISRHTCIVGLGVGNSRVGGENLTNVPDQAVPVSACFRSVSAVSGPCSVFPHVSAMPTSQTGTNHWTDVVASALMYGEQRFDAPDGLAGHAEMILIGATPPGNRIFGLASWRPFCTGTNGCLPAVIRFSDKWQAVW